MRHDGTFAVKDAIGCRGMFWKTHGKRESPQLFVRHRELVNGMLADEDLPSVEHRPEEVPRDLQDVR